MRKIKLISAMAIMFIAVVLHLPVNNELNAEMPPPPCVNNPTLMKGQTTLTYTNGGGIPLANYFTPEICNANFYEWTTNTGYSTLTTTNSLSTDASIFGCGSAWISVRALTSSGPTSSVTKNVTVNCLPY